MWLVWLAEECKTNNHCIPSHCLVWWLYTYNNVPPHQKKVICNIQSHGHEVWYTSKVSRAVLSATQRVPSGTRMSWDLGGVMKRKCVRNCEYTASISLCWLLCVSIHRSSQEEDQSPGWEMRWVFVVEDNTKSSCTQVDAKNRGEKMHHIAVHPCTRTAVGEQITSVSASLFEVSSVYRISKLKCHQPTSAKTVFINAIHPLWIAAATTEKPGDIW